MRADFYFIGEQDLWRFSCRLLEKAFNQQHQVYVHTDTAGDGEKLNVMLWTFRQQSFIPHGMLEQFTTPIPPIEIGFGPFSHRPEHHRDILLNLSEQLPPFVEEFNRVIEIIPNQPQAQNRAEKHQQYYREAGFTSNCHDLTNQQ
ncbi:MAG: DNA polymerase III subunit chi [Gammaproteobacteria bacterium]|nr:DNA polymerase III subunit chi [Gammaproteobacteria bacterium]MCP4474505.1 DNA polymerase III subunit chi [Gammaproteobacteria bacterium]